MQLFSKILNFVLKDKFIAKITTSTAKSKQLRRKTEFLAAKHNRFVTANKQLILHETFNFTVFGDSRFQLLSKRQTLFKQVQNFKHTF